MRNLIIFTLIATSAVILLIYGWSTSEIKTEVGVVVGTPII